MENATPGTRRKAVALNLDATTYGTFAEITVEALRSQAEGMDEHHGAAGREAMNTFANRSRPRVEGDKRTDRCRAVKLLSGYFGRSDLSAEHDDSNLRRRVGPEHAGELGFGAEVEATEARNGRHSRPRVDPDPLTPRVPR